MAKAAVLEKQTQEVEDVINVRAKRVGYYDNRRHYPIDFNHPRAGEVFTLRERSGGRRNKKGKVEPITLTARQQFAPSWMEEVTEQEAESDAQLRRRVPAKRQIITKPAADRSVI